MGSLKRLVVAGLVIVLFTFSLFLTRSQSSSAPDFDDVQSVQDLPEVTLEIPNGATGSQIASILFESGVVKSSQAYFRVAVADAPVPSPSIVTTGALVYPEPPAVIDMVSISPFTSNAG